MDEYKLSNAMEEYYWINLEQLHQGSIFPIRDSEMKASLQYGVFLGSMRVYTEQEKIWSDMYFSGERIMSNCSFVIAR